MSYSVGQILFVVLSKQATIYPMQVVEEITKKTLEGEVTSYMVRTQDPEKIMGIDQIDGEVFETADKAKRILIERVSASISSRIDSAVAKAKEWYPTGFENASDDPISMLKKQTPVGGAPPPVPVKRAPRVPRGEVAELAAELAAETAMMEVPDGKGGVMMAKVKGIKIPPQLQG